MRCGVGCRGSLGYKQQVGLMVVIIEDLLNVSLILRNIPPVWKTIWCSKQQQHFGLVIISRASFSWFASKEVCQMWHNNRGAPKGAELSFLLFTVLSTLQTFFSAHYDIQVFKLTMSEHQIHRVMYTDLYMLEGQVASRICYPSVHMWWCLGLAAGSLDRTGTSYCHQAPCCPHTESHLQGCLGHCKSLL